MRRPSPRNFRVNLDGEEDDGLPPAVQQSMVPRVLTVEDQEADAYRLYVSARLHEQPQGVAVHVLSGQSGLKAVHLAELVRTWREKRLAVASKADQDWARLELLNQYEESRMRAQMCYTLFPKAVFVDDQLKTLAEARKEGQWQRELILAIKDLKAASDENADDDAESKKVSEHIETLNAMMLERTTKANGDITEKVTAMQRATFGGT